MKGLRGIKIVKEVKLEGVWDKLQVKRMPEANIHSQNV